MDSGLPTSGDSGLRLVDPAQSRFPVPLSLEHPTQRGECDVQKGDSALRDEDLDDDAPLEAKVHLDDGEPDEIPNC